MQRIVEWARSNIGETCPLLSPHNLYLGEALTLTGIIGELDNTETEAKLYPN